MSPIPALSRLLELVSSPKVFQGELLFFYQRKCEKLGFDPLENGTEYLITSLGEMLSVSD
jgi:hypothetical protein